MSTFLCHVLSERALEISNSHVSSGPPLAWVGRGSCRPSLCCRYWWTSPYCRGWSQSYLWRDILNRTVLCLFLQVGKSQNRCTNLLRCNLKKEVWKKVNDCYYDILFWQWRVERICYPTGFEETPRTWREVGSVCIHNVNDTEID